LSQHQLNWPGEFFLLYVWIFVETCELLVKTFFKKFSS
jgi:hypothetical protein